MKNLSRVLGGIMTLIWIAGCSDAIQDPDNLNLSSVSSAPNEAAPTVLSATLWVYQSNSIGLRTPANVHRITAPWTEFGVTWENFHGSFDPVVVGSFQTDNPGWHSVDVTLLVQAWENGIYPNYGFLLEQSNNPVTVYLSSEWVTDSSLRPKLEITYRTSTNQYVQVLQRGVGGSQVSDTYIWAYTPYTNGGGENLLYTGAYNDSIKQTLIQFVWEPIGFGCTRTIGYWKTHAGFNRQPDAVTELLPVWLGTPEGTKSVQVTTAAQAVAYLGMKTYGEPSNGVTKLYAQLLGAKLSIASGASGEAIADLLADVDEFFADSNHLDWVSLSAADKALVLSWMSTLDGFNNGLVGPEHCDEPTLPS